MKIDLLAQNDYEALWEAQDPGVHFHAFIAIHNTQRGPALGGLRFWSYPSLRAARQDVLNLAKAMTYKTTIAQLSLGGGKAVLIKPQKPYDRILLMEYFGKFVDHLKGKFLAAKDVGTKTEDMVIIRQQTPWVTGLPPQLGGVGDPSSLTAYGIWIGIKTGVKELWGSQDLKGLKVAIQGAGDVGSQLARLLRRSKSEVWISDVDSEKVKTLAHEIGLRVVDPKDIYALPVQVFAPCALGQVLNSRTIPQIKAKLIAGAANNPLEEESRNSQALQTLGILYAPDFVINAGGIIHVATEVNGESLEQAKQRTHKIGQRLKEIFARARKDKITTLEAAQQIAHNFMMTS